MMTHCECTCGIRFANIAHLQIHQNTCVETTPKITRRKSSRTKTLPRKLAEYNTMEKQIVAVDEVTEDGKLINKGDEKMINMEEDESDTRDVVFVYENEDKVSNKEFDNAEDEDKDENGDEEVIVDKHEDSDEDKATVKDFKGIEDELDDVDENKEVEVNDDDGYADKTVGEKEVIADKHEDGDEDKITVKDLINKGIDDELDDVDENKEVEVNDADGYEDKTVGNKEDREKMQNGIEQELKKSIIIFLQKENQQLTLYKQQQEQQLTILQKENIKIKKELELWKKNDAQQRKERKEKEEMLQNENTQLLEDLNKNRNDMIRLRQVVQQQQSQGQHQIQDKQQQEQHQQIEQHKQLQENLQNEVKNMKTFVANELAALQIKQQRQHEQQEQIQKQQQLQQQQLQQHQQLLQQQHLQKDQQQNQNRGNNEPVEVEVNDLQSVLLENSKQFEWEYSSSGFPREEIDKMGYKGGGLGKNEDGIEEAVGVKMYEDVNKKKKKSKQQLLYILSDSMMGGIDEERLTQEFCEVKKYCHGGCTISCMHKHVNKMIECKPDNVLIHVGTNDCTNNTSDTVHKKLLNLIEDISKKLPKTRVFLSLPTLRVDNSKANLVVRHLNNKIRRSGILCVDHMNINEKHLAKKGLHLNDHGTRVMAANIISFIKQL